MLAYKQTAFRNRAMLFWSRLFASKLERGDNYGAMCPAILVVFLDYVDAWTRLDLNG